MTSLQALGSLTRLDGLKLKDVDVGVTSIVQFVVRSPNLRQISVVLIYEEDTGLVDLSIETAVTVRNRKIYMKIEYRQSSAITFWTVFYFRFCCENIVEAMGNINFTFTYANVVQTKLLFKELCTSLEVSKRTSVKLCVRLNVWFTNISMFCTAAEIGERNPMIEGPNRHVLSLHDKVLYWPTTTKDRSVLLCEDQYKGDWIR